MIGGSENNTDLQTYMYLHWLSRVNQSDLSITNIKISIGLRLSGNNLSWIILVHGMLSPHRSHML